MTTLREDDGDSVESDEEDSMVRRVPAFPVPRPEQKRGDKWIDERQVQAKGLITKLKQDGLSCFTQDGETLAMTILDAVLKGCRSIDGGLTENHETASPACWAALCVQQSQVPTSGEWEIDEQGAPHTNIALPHTHLMIVSHPCFATHSQL